MRRAVSRMHARKYIGRTHAATHARTPRYCEKPCMARVKPRARLDSRVWKWRAAAIVWKWIASSLAAEATTVTNWLSSDLPAASLPACLPARLPTGLVMSLSRKRQEPRSMPRKIGRATHNAATSQTPENAAARIRIEVLPFRGSSEEWNERGRERERERGWASFFSRSKTGVRARGV